MHRDFNGNKNERSKSGPKFRSKSKYDFKNIRIQFRH